MKRRLFVLTAIFAAFIPLTAAAPGSPSPATAEVITVYKDPDCGCCKAWVEYLRKNGYRVVTHDTRDMDEIKTTVGIPKQLMSCHTAIIAGYIIEGHVPAADIARLLRTKPNIRGLAVPGMPAGSPGMEGPPPVHYKVIAFTRSGKTSVFANH